jgi:hypothetical protein
MSRLALTALAPLAMLPGVFSGNIVVGLAETIPDIRIRSLYRGLSFRLGTGIERPTIPEGEASSGSIGVVLGTSNDERLPGVI